MLCLLSCNPGKTNSGEYNIPLYTPSHALGLEIIGAKDRQSTILKVKIPWQGAKDAETLLFISRNGEKAPEGFGGQILNSDPNRIVCMSSTHISMLNAVDEVNRVVGVSSIKYISNPYIVSHKDTIHDIGFEGNINYELLVSLNPDLVLLFGINGASNMEPKLRELNIPFVYIGEYLEESPLGKAEWLVAVAEITGKREAGETLFAGIPKSYNELMSRVANATTTNPKVMINAPYGDSWFMASTSSYVARLIDDAGGDYIYRKNTSNTSMPIDLEEAYLLVSEADMWLNVGYIPTMKELKSQHPKFADTRCVENGEVYNCTKRLNAGGGNDYWESGVINPDLILRDLIKIFHPELVSEEFYYYEKVR